MKDTPLQRARVVYQSTGDNTFRAVDAEYGNTWIGDQLPGYVAINGHILEAFSSIWPSHVEFTKLTNGMACAYVQDWDEGNGDIHWTLLIHDRIGHDKFEITAFRGLPLPTDEDEWTGWLNRGGKLTIGSLESVSERNEDVNALDEVEVFYMLQHAVGKRQLKEFDFGI